MADFRCWHNDINIGIDLKIDNGTAIQENKLDHHVSVCHAFLYCLQQRRLDGNHIELFLAISVWTLFNDFNKKIILNQKIRGFEYALYIIAFIFAANAEQMCAILLGVYFVFTLYTYHSKKIMNWCMIVQTLIGIASMVFVLINPVR